MNRYLTRIASLSAALVMAGATLSADRVKLQSGRTVEGTLISSDESVIRFRLANGEIAEFPIGDVKGVELSPHAATSPSAPNPSRAPAPVTVPAGTFLNVRLTQLIDVDSAHAGATFRSTLDDPVMKGGSVIIPRGARVVLQAVAVKQAGTMKGSDRITLKAATLSFGGVTYDIATSYVETKTSGQGKSTARKVGAGLGLGAVFGGIVGGGTGAGIGAAIGGATGAIVASQGTDHLQIPAETRLQFQLNAAVTVRP